MLQTAVLLTAHPASCPLPTPPRKERPFQQKPVRIGEAVLVSMHRRTPQMVEGGGIIPSGGRREVTAFPPPRYFQTLLAIKGHLPLGLLAPSSSQLEMFSQMLLPEKASVLGF